MVQAANNISSASMAVAARLLMEGDMADASAGRFSHTVFMANGLDDEDLERCAFQAARGIGSGAVSLRPAAGKPGSTLNRANITFVHEGAQLEVRNCVMWAGDDQTRIVLVPFDARDDCHFAIGAKGIERRPGRPAAMLGRGRSLAKARLEQAARSVRKEQLFPGIAIVHDTRAA